MSEAILEQIKQSKDRQVLTLEIPEWRLTLTLQEPTMGQIRNLREQFLVLDAAGKPDLGQSDIDEFNWALIALCTFGEGDSNHLFESGKQAKEILEERSTLIVNRIIEKCGVLTSPPDEAGVQTAIKN